MGLFLDKPKKEKEKDNGEGNGLRYAVCAMQGWRVDMEDSHSVKIQVTPWLKDMSYFAVFDGHAGAFVSKYCANHLLEEVLKGIAHHLGLDSESGFDYHYGQPMDTDEAEAQQPSAKSDSNDLVKSNSSSTKCSETEIVKQREQDPSKASEDSSACQTESANTNIISSSKKGDSVQKEYLGDKLDNVSLKSIICKGFLDMDERLKVLPEFNTGEERSGSTAIAVFVTSKQYIFANCGDSRALLCRNGKPYFVTCDHKPYNEKEKSRIEKAGGSVIIQRVNGSLAVSRSLGDFDYKRVPDTPCTAQLVSAEPELTFVDRSDDDEFLVLACDGVWDVMSNEDAVGYVQSRLKVRENLEAVCDDLLETCLAKGSKDNMSVIIVTFPGAPEFNEEEAAKETKVDEVITQKVTEVVKKHDSYIDVDLVFEALQHEDIGGLPPGGGLPAKLPLIEQVLETLVKDEMGNENANYPVTETPEMTKPLGGDTNTGTTEEADSPNS